MDVQAGYRRAILASVQFPIFTLGLEGEGSVAFYFMDTRAGYRREVIASVQFSILAPTDSWIRWLHLFSKMERWKAHASHALLGLTMASAKKRITLFHLSSKMERWAQAFHVLLGLTMASAKKRTMLFRLFSKRKRTNFSYPVHRSTDDRDWLSMSSSRAENPHLDQAASWPSVHVLTAWHCSKDVAVLVAEETSYVWLFTMDSHAWQLILPLWYGFLSARCLHLPAGMPRKMTLVQLFWN